MTGIIHFEVFLLTGILLNLTPGNDTIFILSRSLAQGRKAGIVSALGISAGSIVHTLLAAFGLSIIIAKSILLFNVIKYIGAVYLLYIGFKMFTEKSKLQTENLPDQVFINYWRIYRAAMLTNILNPKVALFFISFLPQFIDPNYKNTVFPFLLLGATFITTGTIWCLVLAFFASSLFDGFKRNIKVALYINKLCGLALVALGIKVALTDKE